MDGTANLSTACGSDRQGSPFGAESTIIPIQDDKIHKSPDLLLRRGRQRFIFAIEHFSVEPIAR